MRSSKPSNPAESGAGRRNGSRRCDHRGCDEEGLYRAPRGRNALDSYYWFCLDHVRAYNKAWNFYAGMSTDEVEVFTREDLVGWRPTWPVGAGTRFYSRGGNGEIHDPFGLFGESGTTADPATRSWHPWPHKSPECKALTLFDLDPRATWAEIKTRYRELVKRHHPDANGGDKGAEEKLKVINEAYRVLRGALCSPASAPTDPEKAG